MTRLIFLLFSLLELPFIILSNGQTKLLRASEIGILTPTNICKYGEEKSPRIVFKIKRVNGIAKYTNKEFIKTTNGNGKPLESNAVIISELIEGLKGTKSAKVIIAFTSAPPIVGP